LQAVIHTVDDECIAVDGRLVFPQDAFLRHKISPSSRFKN